MHYKYIKIFGETKYKNSLELASLKNNEFKSSAGYQSKTPTKINVSIQKQKTEEVMLLFLLPIFQVIIYYLKIVYILNNKIQCSHLGNVFSN